MDSTASIIMGSALLFYTIGVWSERIQGQLKWWHLGFFGLGLICDTWGTGLMFEFVGGMTFDVHGITGLIAILLMLIHAGWAFVVLKKNDEDAIKKFHKFSVAVWIIWLIPYFSPMFFSMAG
ncbi:MAG: TIGR03987 family protein [Chloroflexi bacterium]|nr:TIGR03987 family protein [Chloroflexota bacterium]